MRQQINFQGKHVAMGWIVAFWNHCVNERGHSSIRSYSKRGIKARRNDDAEAELSEKPELQDSIRTKRLEVGPNAAGRQTTESLPFVPVRRLVDRRQESMTAWRSLESLIGLP